MNGVGFYISYNNHDTDLYGSDTTALVLGQMEKFYILNGDHRAQYATLIESGFDACLEYFRANISLINMRSDKPPIPDNASGDDCDEAGAPQP
jgi:hypothetical protein